MDDAARNGDIGVGDGRRAALPSQPLAVSVRPPTVSTTVSRLEADGVLERSQDPQDPRAYLIRLVPNAPLRDGAMLLERLEQELIGELGPRERKQLLALLERTAERLQAGPDA